MRFADYLAQTGKSQEAAAGELGITQGRVSQLVLGAKPSWDLIVKVRDWSGNEVMPNDWLPVEVAPIPDALANAGAAQ